jgi:putative acyl-CoA dehydrogenase
MTTSTHEVTNQSEPLSNWNVYTGDLALCDAIRFFGAVNEHSDNALGNSLNKRLPEQSAAQLAEQLTVFGQHIGTAQYTQAANQANRNSPVVHNFDSRGRRLDVVEFHPAYHQLMQYVAEQGLAAAPWSASASANAHLLRAAKFMMHSGIEAGVLCPISMTYAVVPALFGQPALLAQIVPKLTALAYDPRPIPWQRKAAMTMGMGMTEKQGGSDVRANTTQAVPSQSIKGQWIITGHKWFFSAPMCDAFLILAQVKGTGNDDEKKAGLTCFFIPSYLENGTDTGQRNAIAIQRLKDKLGNRSNASSEVEFQGASAWAVGPIGKGINTILEMGTMTRIDCALGTAGLMRQALSLAIDHCGQRQAFGRRLIDQPMMQQVLADMALESEAATLLALRVAASLDRTNQAEEHAAGGVFEVVLRRIATPAAKFWICKRGALLAQEAMECLGGNGYVEEGDMARIYREMPLNSIWEGAGNIMGLDILRSLKKSIATSSETKLSTGQSTVSALDAIKQEITPSIGKNKRYDRLIERWFMQFENMALGQDSTLQETNARQLATDIAVLLQAHLLDQISPAFVFEAFCNSRISDTGMVAPPASFGLRAISNADLILARARPKH